MAILGISASGRPKGITSEAVQAVLAATGETCDYVSLAGLKFVGCLGCVACAGDNRCKVQDDWLPIMDKMLAADAIVFGAPTYAGTINALGQACLERTFALRHREIYSLAGKLGVAVAVGGREENSAVASYVQRTMANNLMPVVGTVWAAGSGHCYVCGYGHDCAKGGVAAMHGLLECIEAEHMPPRFAEQERAVWQATRAGRILGSTLRARREGRL